MPAVHVGYAVTLPPASVGVFSLENVKLAAGLGLPLLTGKPVVDFSFAERAHPGRLIYAETVEVDAALVAAS